MPIHDITSFDLFFLSYDEPNAEKHYADLLDKAPWAKRVHGVKGFEAAHRTCALMSETDWFVTVDADNIVMDKFFDLKVELFEDRPRQCLSWDGLNMMNGLIYGNGGLKLWSKQFVLEGGVGHEASDDPRHAVDFCWNPDYQSVSGCYSEVWNNGSAYQAYRVGFREGVKLTLNGGLRIPAKEMRANLHPVNLRNIRIWCSVGNHVEHGRWAMMGARQGWAKMLDPSFDHTVVRDYEWFDRHWDNISGDLTEFEAEFEAEMARTEHLIRRETNISIVELSANASEFFMETFRWRNG